MQGIIKDVYADLYISWKKKNLCQKYSFLNFAVLNNYVNTGIYLTSFLEENDI